MKSNGPVLKRKPTTEMLHTYEIRIALAGLRLLESNPMYHSDAVMKLVSKLNRLLGMIIDPKVISKGIHIEYPNGARWP